MTNGNPLVELILSPNDIVENSKIEVKTSDIPLGLSAIAGISSNFLGGAVSNVNAIIEEIESVFKFINNTKYGKDLELIEHALHIDKFIKKIQGYEPELLKLAISAIDSNPKICCLMILFQLLLFWFQVRK